MPTLTSFVLAQEVDAVGDVPTVKHFGAFEMPPATLPNVFETVFILAALRDTRSDNRSSVSIRIELRRPDGSLAAGDSMDLLVDWPPTTPGRDWQQALIPGPLRLTADQAGTWLIHVALDDEPLQLASAFHVNTV